MTDCIGWAVAISLVAFVVFVARLFWPGDVRKPIGDLNVGGKDLPVRVHGAKMPRWQAGRLGLRGHWRPRMLAPSDRGFSWMSGHAAPEIWRTCLFWAVVLLVGLMLFSCGLLYWVESLQL